MATETPIDLQWGKQCLHLFLVVFYLILFILAGNEDMHKISDKLEFLPDRTTNYGVIKPLSVPIDFEWGKWCLHLFSVAMKSDFINLTGNEDRHKIFDRVEF